MQTKIVAMLASALVAVNAQATEPEKMYCSEDFIYGENPSVHTLQNHGWHLVRRVKQGNMWHPAQDHAIGSQTYGKCDHNDHGGANTFSCKYDNVNFDQILFTSGLVGDQMPTWLMTTKGAALDMFGARVQRNIIASSGKEGSYKAHWYNRPRNAEDPWISVYDHWHNDRKDQVYGENSFNTQNHGTIPRTQNGANVYIRSTTDCQKGYNVKIEAWKTAQEAEKKKASAAKAAKLAEKKKKAAAAKAAKLAEKKKKAAAAKAAKEAKRLAKIAEEKAKRRAAKSDSSESESKSKSKTESKSESESESETKPIMLKSSAPAMAPAPTPAPVAPCDSCMVGPPQVTMKQKTIVYDASKH